MSDKPPRRLEQTLTEARSAYLNARINSALGFCEKPVHPLERAPLATIVADRRHGANHLYKTGEIIRRN